MRLFRPIYQLALRWAGHPKAPIYLAFISFIEASFFPGPPETMLAPMTLARPEQWARYATISLVFSVLGSFLGYAIGYFAIDWVTPWLQKFGYWDSFLRVKQLAAEQGFWLLLLGGFTPVPLKIFTLAAGAVAMPIWPFLAGMIIGRGKRVYLLAGIIRWGGAKAEAWLHRWIEWVGWVLLLTLIALVVVFKFFH